MFRRFALFASLSVFAFVTMVIADEAKKEFKATCPVSKKPALKDKTADYRGATVYFCCEKCPVAFSKDTKKFATRANMQLVQTGQAKEVKCPLTGKELNTDTKIKVGDAEVCFCCNMCKGKVEKATGDDQLDLVYGDKAFEKGFEVTKKAK